MDAASAPAVESPAVAVPARRPDRAAVRPRVLALRWDRTIFVVPLEKIVRIEANDNHVTVVADRRYRHRDTITRLAARLGDHAFVRVHRSHLVNVAAVSELAPRAHGEYVLVLADGDSLRTGRTYRDAVQRAFGLQADCGAGESLASGSVRLTSAHGPAPRAARRPKR